MMLYMEVECSHCKKTIETQPWKIKKHKNLFCSKECHYKFRTVKILMICSVCGKDFFRRPKVLEKNQTTTCSSACSHKAVSQLFSLTRTCKTCGEEFTFPKSRAKHFKKEYCSIYCSNSREARGYTHEAKYREIAFRQYPKKCYFCDAEDEKKLDVHHIDHNRKNNAIKNLCVLCVSCHRKIHFLHPTQSA